MSEQRQGAEKSLASRVRGGGAWGGLNIAVSRILQFVTTIIVARIIAPEEFGVLAVAIVVQTIALNIGELGTTAALARGDRDPDGIAPTVFTLSLATSAALTLIMVGTAPWLSAAMGVPSATPVVQVMALSVFLAGLAAVPSALIWRDFLQKRRIAVDVTSIVVALVLVVPLALIGLGAMALAWSRVGGQLVSTIGYWMISPRRYLPGWNRAEIGALIKLGMPLALSNLVVFVTLNVDYIVVGRALGPTELGLYLMAFNLAALPSSVITAMIRTVAIPVFGRLHAQGALETATARLVRATAWIAFPISAVIAALGADLMVAFYGARWEPAAAALLGLCVLGAARILSALFADLCVGAGKTVGLFWVQVVWLAALIPATIAGVGLWGIAGAGYAHATVAWLVVVPAYLFAIRRAIGARPFQQLWAFLPVLGAGIVAGFAGWGLASMVDGAWPSIVIGGAGAAIVYLALTVPVGRDVLAMLRRRDDPDSVATVQAVDDSVVTIVR